MITLKCGLIGCGGIAQNQHLPNLTRSSSITLKTICDLNPTVLEETKNNYQIPYTTTNYKDILSDKEIQIVVIATREDMQAPLTIEFLNAGKNVYVEKPLSDNAEKCQEVLDVQRKTGKFVAVGFNRRFAPAYLKAKEIIDKHGGAKNIQYRIADHYWMWSKHYGFAPGTRVIHEVCHVFDIIRWFTNSEVDSIYSIESRSDDDIIAIKMKNNTVVSILNSGYVTEDMPKERLEIICDTGAITVEDFVEVRTYGYMDCDHIYRFPGHTHSHKEYMYKFLLEKIGAEGWDSLRRVLWELSTSNMEFSQKPESGQIAEIQDFLKNRNPITNYMVDKGWFHALEHFAKAIIDGKQPSTAGPADGFKASMIANSVIRSRQERKIIYL
jgi:predicted dehydrogenase